MSNTALIMAVCALSFISFCAKWIKDTLQFHYQQSFWRRFNYWFWNPEYSWENKYVKGSRFKKWLFKNPLAFTTDAWHLFQFIELNAIITAISLPTILIYNSWIIAIFAFAIIRLLYMFAGFIFYKNK